MAWVLLVIVLAIFQFVFFGFAVGRARAAHGVPAPAQSGHPVFERYFRVHMNTLEQLVAFLPAVWLFSQFVDAHWAAALGALYLIGRMIYFVSYVKDPKSRGLGFLLTALPTFVMLLGVAWQALMMLLLSYRT
ncbi:MAG: MAPEG family protein [Steroidobacteraceae bacterium]